MSALRANDDLRIAARCTSGDASARRTLFERHRRHVHATLFRILGANTEMDDLAQETFLEIFRSLGSFRGEASLSTWIDRITVRVAYAYLRRRPVGEARLEAVPDVALDGPSAEDRMVAREAARRLYTLLDRLEPKQRIAFTLHVVDGRPLAEVASTMDSSLVTTKVRVWRAWRAFEKRARRDPLLSSFLKPEPAPVRKG